MSQENYDAGFAAGVLVMQAKADEVIREIGVAGEGFIEEAFDEGYKEGVADATKVIKEELEGQVIISDKLRLAMIDAFQNVLAEGKQDEDLFKVLAAGALIQQLENAAN